MPAPMDPSSLVERMGSVQVVDVRYPNEWSAGHIDGAVHIPQDYLYERLDELDRSRPVVTVCRSGNRSAQAAQELADAGFEVHDLAGGMQAWEADGLPIVADDGTSGTVAEPEPPPDKRPAGMQQLQSEFLGAIFAVAEHFGDRQPTEQEVQAFLRQWSIDQGETPEEVDALFAAMDTPPESDHDAPSRPQAEES